MNLIAYSAHNNTSNVNNPARGINRFREASGFLIKQCLQRYDNVDAANYEKHVQPRVRDQLQKINLVYRLSKTVLQWHCDSQEELHEKFQNVLDQTKEHFGSLRYSYSEAPAPDQFTQSSKDLIDTDIEAITDSIVSFMIASVNSIDSNIAWILDEKLIWELFSDHVAENSTSDILDSISEDSRIWFQEEIEINRQEKRDIEELDEICQEKFFANSNVSEYEMRKQLDVLKLAYWICKWKFSWRERRTWDRYFKHLREVIDILFENNPNITLEQVIIAMLHDSVEDTNISIDTIRKLFGDRIALSVALLSKKSPLYFENDTQSSEAMSANEILNNNNELKDHIRSLVKNAWVSPDLKKWAHNTQDDEKLVRAGLTINQIDALRLYYHTEKKTKGQRVDEYFGRFKSTGELDEWENLIKYASTLPAKFGFYLSESDIEDCCNNAIIVKAWDVIHNLSTMWKDGVEFKRKKVKEAILGLLLIVKKRSPKKLFKAFNVQINEILSECEHTLTWKPNFNTEWVQDIVRLRKIFTHHKETSI